DRTERAAHRAHVGLGQGLPAGVGGVDARVHPGAVFENGREEAELRAGAAHLTLEPGERQGRLAVRPLDDVIGRPFQSLGDGAEQVRADGGGGVPAGFEGVRRGLAGPVHFGGGGGGEVLRQKSAGRRIERPERRGNGRGSAHRASSATGVSIFWTMGRWASASSRSARVSASSAPVSSRRGGRTRALPQPIFSCTSLMSCTNFGTVSRRSRGRNQRLRAKASSVLPSRAASKRATDSCGKALTRPAIQPTAPAATPSTMASSTPIRISSRSPSRARIAVTRRTSVLDSLTAARWGNSRASSAICGGRKSVR